jgi:hypothetical protein
MTNEIETGTFEQRAREVFDASVDGIDAATRSRLNQARQAATAELERSRRSPWLTSGGTRSRGTRGRAAVARAGNR